MSKPVGTLCGAAHKAPTPHLDGREAADAKPLLGILVLLSGSIDLHGAWCRPAAACQCKRRRAGTVQLRRDTAAHCQPHLGEHDFRVVILERGGSLVPVGLQVLAVAAPGGVELQAGGHVGLRMSGGMIRDRRTQAAPNPPTLPSSSAIARWIRCTLLVLPLRRQRSAS